MSRFLIAVPLLMLSGAFAGPKVSDLAWTLCGILGGIICGTAIPRLQLLAKQPEQPSN